VGAQFKLPYVQVLVNNSYLGLIRQSQRGFEMDYCVQLAFENIKRHRRGAEGLRRRPREGGGGPGLQGLRVTDPEEDPPAMVAGRGLDESTACRWWWSHPREGDQHRHGHRDRHAINEFEDIDCRHPEGRQGLEMAGLLE
jgi:tartronate-semialdehyde synthase